MDYEEELSEEIATLDDGGQRELETYEEEEEEEEEEGQGGAVSCWASIPDVCLREAFWWLGDPDRVRAALVCRHWHWVMRSPSLWRKRTFTFSGRCSRSRRSLLESVVCYAQSLGNYLEDLEIRFSHPLTSLVSRRFQLTLRTFLAAMQKTNGHLRSLTLDNMELDRVVWCPSVRGVLVRSLTCYLRRESSHLDYLSLRGARLNLPQGLDILEAASHLHLQQRRHLGISTMILEDFFSQRITVYSHPAFLQVMQRFRGLCALTLNYSCVSGELLEGLAVSCVGPGRMGTLRSLTLLCHVHEPHGQVVRGEAWARLVKSCPHMRVHISVDRIFDMARLEGILLPGIPLCSISMTSSYVNGQDWSARPVLSYLLPFYRDSLEKLSLDLNNSHESVGEELLELISTCSRLSYLRVWAFLDVSFLDHLLQKCLGHSCALRTIEVRLHTRQNETGEEIQQLEEIFARYRQLIDTQLNYFTIFYPTV